MERDDASTSLTKNRLLHVLVGASLLAVVSWCVGVAPPEFVNNTNEKLADTSKRCEALKAKPAVKPGFTFPEEGEPGNNPKSVEWARQQGIFSNASDHEIPLRCELYDPTDQRIIYFLHIHKAGGSTLCSTARANTVFAHFAFN